MKLKAEKIVQIPPKILCHPFNLNFYQLPLLKKMPKTLGHP